MIVNLIQDIRADIVQHFDNNSLVPDTEENYYRQTDSKRNWIVSKIEVFQTGVEEKIFEFIRNDDSLFHG